MDSIILSIREKLVALGTEERRLSSARFFKADEYIKTYGVGMSDVGKIARSYIKEIACRDKNEILALCDSLWQSTYIEECVIACIWAESRVKEFEEGDIDCFERWINQYVDNWATCDTLCNHTIGGFLMRFPNFIERVKRWAYSENRWMRRAASVSLIIPARKGFFLSEIFQIADSLLIDNDDLVQKGYGWMLKAASEHNPRAVFEYLIVRKESIPRTAYRYALEKMPAEWRAEAMKKG